MANNKEGYVDLFIPKGFANDDPNEFISLNGKNYILPKGKTSKVPVAVKRQYEKSLRAQERLDATSERFIEKAKQPIEM
jgi:hypothetical protein